MHTKSLSDRSSLTMPMMSSTPTFRTVPTGQANANVSQWTAIIAPPMTLTAQYLQQQGIATKTALIIHNAKVANKFLTLLKAAQSPTIAVVVTWDDGLTVAQLFQVQSTMHAYNKKFVVQQNKNLH